MGSAASKEAVREDDDEGEGEGERDCVGNGETGKAVDVSDEVKEIDVDKDDDDKEGGAGKKSLQSGVRVEPTASLTIP